MSDVIGRGVIELSADSSKLNAVIADARARLKGMGDGGKETSAAAAASIDKYIRGLQTQNATLGKSSREIALYKLALRGATDEQLRAANSALKTREAFDKHAAHMGRLKDFAKSAYLSIAAVIGLAGGASIAGLLELSKAAGEFQDLAEKTGTSAEALASMAVAAKAGGVEMSGVADMLVKLNYNLNTVTDESKDAGKALRAVGLNIAEFKNMSGADKLEALGRALNQYADSEAKANVMRALAGKTGPEYLSFLKGLGGEVGRQNILTAEQIKLAHDASDRQKIMREQLKLHAEAIATKMLPVIEQFTGKLSELAKNETVVSAVTATMQGGLWVGIKVFQTVASLFATIAFVIRSAARELWAFKNEAVAVGRLDFSGAKAIAKKAADETAKERADLGKFMDGLAAMDEAKPPELPKKKDKAKDGEGDKPKINFTMNDPEAAAKALAERKAQIALDVEAIRKGSEAVLNTYQNADKILMSRRQSQLIDEQDFYEAKKELIRLDADEQARALQAEINRLSKEKFVGKDRLENQKKIQDAQAKLNKVREDEAVALDVNNAEAEMAVRRIAEAYKDAAKAARDYIDTVKRQTQREVDTAGIGEKTRAYQMGVGEIQEKLIARKSELDRQLDRKDITKAQYDAYLALARDTYSQEVQAFNDRTSAIERLQADGFKGMTEALRNYADNAKNIAGMTQTAFTNALQGLEDQFVSLASTGKASFKDLFTSITADIARIGFRSMIGKGIDSLFGSVIPSGGGASPVSGLAAALGLGGGAVNAASTASQTAAVAALSTAETAAATAISTASITSSTSLEALTAAAGTAATALAAMSATSAGASGTGLVAAVAGAAGGRAIGGPVSAGQMYRVNEQGPELLTVAGKQYLMAGKQGGMVSPAEATSARGGDTYVNVNVAPPPGASRATAMQFGAAAGRQMQLAMRRNG